MDIFNFIVHPNLLFRL